MKLRTRLVQPTTLQQVVHALEKVGSTCTLVVSEDVWSFRITGESVHGPTVLTFANINVRSAFENYAIGSKNGNTIVMEVSVASLGSALKSCIRASKVLVTLIKRPSAGRRNVFLSFSISQGELSDLVQDVPVDIQLPRRATETEEPDLPPPACKVGVEDLRSLKNVVDKLKSMSSFGSVSTASNGELALKVETGMVSIETLFKCKPGQSQSQRDSQVSRMASNVDLRRFSRCLSCSILEPGSSIACIVPNHSLVLHIDIGGGFGTITYYIPLLNDED